MSVTDSIKRSSLELVLLSLLDGEDMYGYQLCQAIESRSGGLYILQESSMYPILYRLEDKGLISCHKETVGKRRVRVYYHLEPSGRTHLADVQREYLSLNRGILRILNIPCLDAGKGGESDG